MIQVDKAAEVLNSGGIVIFPTETVYGIGCLINDSEAIKKLYELKGRSQNKPTAVLVKDFYQAIKFIKSEYIIFTRTVSLQFWHTVSALKVACMGK